MDRFNRIAQGASLIAGPALNVAATFLWDDDGRHGVTGGALAALASVAWAYGLLGLWDRLRPERPVWATLGSLAAIVGTFGGIAFGLQGFYEAVFGLSGEQSLDALAEHPVAAQLVLWLPGPTFPLSMIALGLALALTRKAPLWTALLLAAAGAVFPVSRIPRIEAVAHVADLLLLVPSAYLGVTLILAALSGRTKPAR